METICQLASLEVEYLTDINGVADLLGMTRQGAYKLAERDETFPEPEVEVTAGRIWLTEAIEEWMLRKGNRRVVNLLERDDQFKRFRLVVGPSGIEVIIPLNDLKDFSELRWARSIGRIDEGDKLNLPCRYIPLIEWDQRFTPGGKRI